MQRGCNIWFAKDVESLRGRILWPKVERDHGWTCTIHLTCIVNSSSVCWLILLFCRRCFLKNIENPVSSNEWDSWDVQEISRTMIQIHNDTQASPDASATKLSSEKAPSDPTNSHACCIRGSGNRVISHLERWSIRTRNIHTCPYNRYNDLRCHRHYSRWPQTSNCVFDLTPSGFLKCKL